MSELSKATVRFILGTDYLEVLRLQREDGLREYQAVARVLGIEENSDFVSLAMGTSSTPEDGLKVLIGEHHQEAQL